MTMIEFVYETILSYFCQILTLKIFLSLSLSLSLSVETMNSFGRGNHANGL